MSISLISIGLILFIINFKYFNKKKELFYLLLVYLFSSLFLILYSEHPIDSNMYHHPFVSYLNSEKIIFAVANIQFRFGHISFLQYVQASLTNNYFNILNLSAPNIILYISFIYFCAEKIFTTKKINFVYLLITILSSFLLIKYGRYREFGNDLIPMLVSFYALIRITEEILFKKNSNILLNFFPIYVIFIFAHKISYIFSALIFLTILNIKKFDYRNLNKKIIIIFLLFSFTWIAKNFINTSCFAYPIVSSCITTTSWQLTGLSDPVSTAWLTEIWAKDFITHPDWQNINLKEYGKNFNWVNNWLNNHFIKILEKLSPIFIFLIYIFMVGFIYKKNNLNKNIEKKIYLMLLFCLLGVVVWFINAPIFRYGSFYLISSLSIFSILIYNKFFGFNKNLKIKYLNFLFIFSLIFFIGKNINRIYKSETEFFPTTILEFKEIDKNYEILGNDKIKIIKAKGRVCFYTSQLCSHEVPNNIKIIKYGNYVITKP